MSSKIINLIIDLIFDKHCRIKEVSYQQDVLVCDDLEKLKEDLKKNLNEVLKEYEK